MISIGIDVHKKKCVATLKRDSKRIVEQTSFCNNSYGINEFIQHIKGYYKEDAIAVCESTGNYWIRLHDTLEDNGINTLLANSLKTKIIAQAKLKDDKIDSNVLVDLLRADLVYESFVPDKEYRELRQLVRTRLDLVTERTVLKNKVHALLAKYEYQCPVSHIFSNKGTEWLKTIDLSWIDRMAVDAYLDALDSGDAHRNGGHITRQGSKWLRYTIVEAANTSTRCDDRIGRFYKRIAERRGPQKARVAAAKEMLVIIWYMLIKNEPYRTMNREMV